MGGFGNNDKVLTSNKNNVSNSGFGKNDIILSNGITNQPIEEKGWFSKAYDFVTGKSNQTALDYIYGKDKDKKDISSPVTTSFSDNEGDNLESSKYKIAALKTTGKVNLSPYDLDNPYLMQKLLTNKSVLDKQIEDVKTRYKETQDPTVLSSFYDNQIKPLFENEKFSLKENLEKDIFAKQQEQIRNLQPQDYATFQLVNLPKQLSLSWMGFNPTELQSEELTKLNSEIAKLESYDKELSSRPWREPTKEDEVIPGIRTRADIGNKLAELQNRKKDIISEQRIKLKQSEKDLGDLFKLQQNIQADIQATYDYKSELPEATRKNPDILIEQSDDEFLYNLSKYGTTSASLKSTELLDANLTKFNKTWDNVSLKDLLSDTSTDKSLDYYTSRLIGDRVKFQEDTYKGIVKLEENIKANKNEKYGYPSVIKELEKLKKEKIQEYKEKGVTLTEEQLSQYNREILKYTDLLNKQTTLEEKLNSIKRNYLSQFKDEKAYREEQSKLAQIYLKEENSKLLDYLKFESKPLLNTLYNMSFGSAEALEKYMRKGEEKIGLISKQDNIREELLNYDSRNNSHILYIPDPIKNREAVKITESESGKYNFEWSLSGVASEALTTFIESYGLAKSGVLIGKNLKYLPFVGKAAPFLSESVLTGIGGTLSSNLMLSDIDKQNLELFLEGKISWDDVNSKSTLEKSLEGATEMLWTPELKMLDEVGQDVIKKYAKKQFLKQALGESFLTEDFKYLAKSILKNVVQTPLNESIEELAGNLGQDVLIDPIYKKNNLQYNPELNFTLLNNLQTAIVTTLSMIPTSIIGLGGDVRNRRNIGKLMDYEIGKNSEEFLKYAIAGINSLESEEFSNLYPQFNSKDQAINSTKKVYDDYNKAYKTSIPTLDFLVSENQKRDYFDTNLQIQNIVQSTTKTEKDLEQLQKLQEKKSDYDLIAQDLKNKPIREQLSTTIDENIKNINLEEVNVPSLQLALEQLKKWKSVFGKDSKYKDKVELIDSKISEVEKRINSLKPINPEEKKIEQQQKVKQDATQGKLEITTKRGKRVLELGKKYLVGRTLDFDSKQPIKFSDVTFIGYVLDGQGNPIMEKGSPVVKFTSGGKEYQAPVSYFENYTLGAEEAIKKSDSASFYDKFKNKRFVLSLAANKFNKLAKSKKFAKVDVDSVDGILSFEDGKLYFNFINPVTGKEDYLELDDFTIKQYDKYGKNAFFKPKTATYKGTIKEGQFENLTPDELFNLGLMSEKEEKEYEEWVKNKEFKEEKIAREAQKQRRLGLLQDYIKKVSKNVLNTDAQMEKVNDKIEKIQALAPLLRDAARKVSIKPNSAFKSLLTKKEFEDFKNLSPYYKVKMLLAKARSIETGFQEDIKKLTDNLMALESKRAEHQKEIQDELDFIEEVAESELDPDKSLKDQITEERKAIQDTIKNNESLIDNLKKQVSYLEGILQSFKTTLDNMFSLFATERTSSFTNEEEVRVAQDIVNLEAEIRKREAENKELQNLVNNYKRLERYLAPLEKARKKKEQLRKRKEILEELKKQSDAESSQQPSTGSNLEDKKQKDESSAKKDLSVIPVSTTSGGEKYEEFLQDPTNNYAAARYVHFTNSVDPTQFELMAVTAQNVKEIEKKYNVDLSGILFEKQYDTDVKFVVVKKTKEDYSFVDMNGNIITNPTKDNVVYTSLSKSETVLVSNSGKTRYNEKELPENKEEAKKKLDAVQKEFTDFRNGILTSKEIFTYKITGVSRGIPNYDNEKELDKETNEEVFENTINRKPIQGTIVPEKSSLVGTLVIGTKGQKIKDHNGNDVNVPVGRPVVVTKDGAKTQFADNHHLSETKANDVFNIIRLLAKKINQATEEDFEEGKKIIDTKLTKYLKSVLYWRNPDVSKQEIPNNNQIWISFDYEFGAILNIGNKKLPMSSIEENLDTLRAIISEVWHNVDAAALNKANLEYVEITNVDPKKGTYTEVVWDSYEDYLMSSKNPDGTDRNIKDIPLTTNLITSVNPIDQNGKLLPNYKPQYQGRYLTFARPIISDKGAPASPNNESTAQTPPVVKPTITETPDVEENIKNILNSAREITLEGSIDTTRERIQKGINFLQGLKNGVTYSLFDNKTLNDLFRFTPTIENGKVISFKIEIVNQERFERFSEYVGGVENFLKLTGVALNSANILGNDKFDLKEVSQPTAKVEDTSEKPVEFIDASEMFGDVQENTDPNNQYRLAVKTNYQKTNIQKAKEWLNKVLPNISFEDVEGLIDGVAWGVFRNNGIILSRAAEVGTEYHEAFEAVAGLLLTRKQWVALTEEFKKREGEFIEYNTGKKIKYSQATPSQIKEQLAEEYRDYQLSDGKKIFDGQIKRNNIFRRIYNLIKELIFGKPDTINEVFQKISEGKYANTAPQRWTRPWNINKAYRIANLENGIFAMQLNKSLSNMLLVNLLEKTKSNIYSLFEGSDIVPTELYSDIKNKLNQDYTQVTIKGELKTLPLIEKYGIEGIIKNLDNPQFLNAVITNINSTPKVFRNVWNQTLSETLEPAQRAILFQTKLKDALTGYNYINSNWEELVQKNVDYLKKFKIEISEVFDENGGVIVENEDLKQGNEYTKDPFQIDARDNSNSKVKFLIATLSKRELVTVDNQVQFDENGLPRTREVINNLGLPEIVDYSTAFRTIFNTVIDSTNILEMMEAIKKASIQNPELAPLWYRLAGNKSTLTEEEQRLRISFNSSLNKFKSNFVRGLYEETENGIVTNIIDSIQDQVEKVTKEKWLNGLKNLYKEGSPYFKEVEKGIKIEVKGTDLQKLAESKDLKDKIELAKRLSIEFSFNENVLTDEERKDLSAILMDFQNVLLSSQDMSVILAGERIDFNATLDKLARLQYKIDKKSTEVNHFNIDKERQYDIVGLSFFTTLIKDIRSSKNFEDLLAKNPHLQDLYHQGSFLLNNYLFNKNTRNRTEFPIDLVPVEGSVDSITQKGSHSSKLPFNERVSLEFNANLRGIFYVLTPADVKTEYGLTYFGKIKNTDKRFTNTPRNYENLFNRFFKRYLEAEINIARDIKENPTKRDVAEYNVPVVTKNSGVRTKGTSLRAFDGILSFDYSQIIDDNSLDIDSWINSNKDVILKDLQAFVESLNQETFKELIDNELVTPIGKKLYQLKGFDSDYLADKQIKQSQAKEEDVLDMINERNINYIINVFEQFSLFLGDPAQSSEPFKRIKAFVTSRESTTYDTELTNGEVFDNFANTNYNKATIEDELGNTEEVDLPEDAPGHRVFDSTFTGTTIKDVEIVERTIDSITNSHLERESSDLFFKSFDQLTPFLKKMLNDSVIAPIKKVYQKITETDGQAYLTLPLYREFLRRSDQWNPDLEKMYQFDLAYERSKIYNYPDTEQGRKLQEIDKKIIERGNPNIQRVLEGKDPVTYPILKPIGSGVKAGNLSIRNLDKMSAMALSYRLLESQGSKGLKIYNNAIKTKTDFLRYESAQKEGKPKTLSSIYDNEGKITGEIISRDRLMFKYFAIQVETRGLKNKVARATQLTKLAVINLMNAGIPIDFIKSHTSKRTDLPDASNINNSSKLKQYFKDLKEFNKNMIKDALSEWNSLSEEEKRNISPVYRAVQDHTSILNTLTDVYRKELYQELGAKETQTGVEISNYEILEKLIREELTDRGTPQNLLSAIKLKDGKFELPFDFLPNGFKVQPLLMSLVDSRIARPKLNGKALAQAASTMFEKEDRQLVYLKDSIWTPVKNYNELSEEDKSKVRITSNELLFYGDKYVEESGKRRLATEKEIESGEAKTANFAEVYLPPIFKDSLGNFIDDTGKIDPELLKIIGFRIPNQELSSNENIRIKGFLPLEYGNMVIVPSSITGKAGSDFDIDKLTLYLYNYFLNDKGTPTKIQYLDESSTVQERYKQFIKHKMWSIFNDIKSEEEFQEVKKEKLKPVFDKLSKIIDKKLEEVEESKQATIAFEEFKKSVNEIKNERLKSGILNIIKKSKTVSIYQRQENLEKYIKEASQASEFKDIKVLDNVLLAYDYYISLMNEKNKVRSLLYKAIKGTVGYQQFQKEINKINTDVFADYIISEDLLIEGIPFFTDFQNLPIQEQNSKKALENKYIDTLITLLELPENYTRLTTPNSAKVLQDGAVMIERLQRWAEFKKEGKTDEEIEKMLDEESKQEKSKTKRLNISDWFNPVKNARTRYSFQIGKEGVGIGAVGITNHAINQLVNSLGSNFNTVTLYFDTNPVEVTTVEGKKLLLTQLSFTRDSNGQWISNNISAFINAFVDIAKDPFIIKIHGNLDTAGSYILANKLGMNINDTILLFNQPIIREFERLETLRKSNLSSSTKKEVLESVISRFGKPGFISYDKEEGIFIQNILALKKARNEKFTTEELEDFIKNQYDRDSQRLEQTILLATYLELKEGSNSNRSAVNNYNWDTDASIDFLSVIMKAQENKKYEEESNPNKPKIFINTDDLFFSKVKQSYIEFTKMFKDIFVSMQDDVFNAVTGKEVEKFFDAYISDRDRFKAVTAIQKEIVNYLILTTPVELFGKSVIIGDLVKPLLVKTEKSPAKQLKRIQKDIKEGKITSFYGIQELFSTIAGEGKRKTNNIRILNKQKDVEYSDIITDSWKEAENSSNAEISNFIKNLYLLSLVQSGINQSRISISQYLPSDFMKSIATQVVNKLKEGKIDFSRFRPLFYANKWNDKNFTKKLSYKQVSRVDFDDPAIRYSLIFHRKNLGIKADTFIPTFAKVTKDDSGNITSLEITNYYSPNYQLSYTSIGINPKTGHKYTKAEVKEAKTKGIDPYVTKIYQRVELNGSPVLIKNNQDYDFVYREVTKKGDGQYVIEYADKSEIHTNLEPQSDAEILAEFEKNNITYTTIDEFKRSFSNPNEQSPFTQEAEEVQVKQLTQPTAPVVTPTVTTEVIEQSIQNKEGVPELFDSNPELANAVYEALGFKQDITLENKLKTFFNNFGFKFEEGESSIDLLNKIIYTSNKDSSVFINNSVKAISQLLLANTNIDFHKLEDLIENTPEFKKALSNSSDYLKTTHKFLKDGNRIPMEEWISYIKDYNKIKNEVLEKYIKESLLDGKNSTGLHKLINDFLKWFKDLFKNAKNLKEVTDSLVQQVLLNQKEVIINSKDLQNKEKVTLAKALEETTHGKDIIKTFGEFGLILTGSVSAAEQGSIFRKVGKLLHDIDWVVPKGFTKDFNKKLKDVFPGATLVRKFDSSSYYTQTYIVPPKGYTISNLTFFKPEIYGERKYIASYDVLDKNGNIVSNYRRYYDVKESGKVVENREVYNEGLENVDKNLEAVSVDFFQNKEELKYEPYTVNIEGISLQLSNWLSSFTEKLKYGRAKDLLDYANFIPNDVVSSTPQITPQQKQEAQQLYSQYLDTIFPNSVVKDIVYHGTTSKEKFEKFKLKYGEDESFQGFYFADTKFQSQGIAGKEGRVFPVILNANPKIGEFGITATKEDINQAKSEGYNALREEDITRGKNFNTTIVFEPEQIHILGSKQDIEGFKKFVEQPINKEIKEDLTPKANIPQNLVSGGEAFGTKQEALPEIKKVLGNNPHSIDMIEAGFRTRTTRSVGEMEKYNIKVGDIVKQFGKSADGTTKNILTRVTAIHPKGTPEFLRTWNKEGWTQEGIKAIERFKDGAAAIEFELLTQQQPIVEEKPLENPDYDPNNDPNCPF